MLLKNKIFLILLGIGSLLLPLNGQGQTTEDSQPFGDEVTFDSLANSPSKTVPFDVPLTVKTKFSKEEGIRNLFYKKETRQDFRIARRNQRKKKRKYDRNRKLSYQKLSLRRLDITDMGYKNDSLRIQKKINRIEKRIKNKERRGRNVKIRKKPLSPIEGGKFTKKNNYLFTMPPLKPQCTYRVYKENPVAGKNLDLLMQSAVLLKKDSYKIEYEIEKRKEAKSKAYEFWIEFMPIEAFIKECEADWHEQKIQSMLSSAQIPFNQARNNCTGMVVSLKDTIFQADFEFPSFRMFRGFFKSSMKAAVAELLNHENGTDNLPPLDSSDNRVFVKVSNIWFSGEEVTSSRGDQLFTKKTDYSPYWKDLINLDGKNKAMLQKGMITFPVTLSSKKAKEYEYGKRLKNLKKTSTELNKMYESLEAFRYLNISEADPMIDSTMVRIKRWDEYVRAASEKIIAVQKILQKDHKPIKFSEGEIMEFSSTVKTFDERVKQIVVADVGVMSVIQVGNVGFSNIQPYAGMSINFGPVNTDVPLRYTGNRKAFHRHYLAVHLGVTFNSIAEEGVREDLFNKNNLMIGLAGRIGHTFKISGGFLLFRQEDPNPLIDKMNAGMAPYLSLAIDLRVAKALEQIGKAFLPIK